MIVYEILFRSTLKSPLEKEDFSNFLLNPPIGNKNEGKGITLPHIKITRKNRKDAKQTRNKCEKSVSPKLEETK